MKSRPFAYNPSLTPIPGTDQVGTLAIGVTQQDYSANPGGVQWWIGPDEELGYIICEPVSTGDFPTPIGNIGTVKFWRSVELTTSSFLEITNLVFNQNFTTGTNAKSWLNSNGYWTSWNNSFNYSTNLLYWPSSSTGYTLYNGTFTSSEGPPYDDAHTTTPLSIPSFTMASSASTSLYVSTNGYISLGSPTDDSPYYTSPQDWIGMIAGNPDDNFLYQGQPLSDGDTQNLYYQTLVDDVFTETKILVYSAAELITSTPSSYILNLYRDSTYQWIETRIKDTSVSKGKCGPYNSTDVSVQSSTTSHVWRGDLNGENWVYMGTGSVSRT